MTYTYDLNSRQTLVQDATGAYGFTYDNMNRLTQTTTQYAFLTGQNFQNGYADDAASNRKMLTAPDGSTNAYTYDALNRLATLTNSLTGQFGFGYDALSRRNSLTRPMGVNTTYTYDPVSNLLSVLHKLGTTILDGASYTYDPANNRKTRVDKRLSTTLTYGYDNIYELLSAKQGSTTKETYTYDAVGNRLSSLGVSPYSYNPSNELTATPSASYTYDNNGNTLTKSGGTTYSWDFENRLVSAVVPGTGTVAFKYDLFGRRVQKSSASGTTNYLYDGDGDNAIEELDGSGNVLARYAQTLEMDELLSEYRSGLASYYEQDGLSSVSSLSNSGGTLANTYVYDSFGKMTTFTGTLTNPFRYTARDYDMESGLYYYRARYYDTSAGRFLSEDPLGVRDQLNMYVHVRNNPTNFDDPFGLYQTKGFDPDQRALLDAAIAEALAKLREQCPNCAGPDGPKIADAIERTTFVYKPKLKDCGETGPLTFWRLRHEVALGPNAFRGICCSLASTLTHEVVHSLTHGENKAYDIEQKCFGCSDARKP